MLCPLCQILINEEDLKRYPFEPKEDVALVSEFNFDWDTSKGCCRLCFNQLMEIRHGKIGSVDKIEKRFEQQLSKNSNSSPLAVKTNISNSLSGNHTDQTPFHNKLENESDNIERSIEQLFFDKYKSIILIAFILIVCLWFETGGGPLFMVTLLGIPASFGTMNLIVRQFPNWHPNAFVAVSILIAIIIAYSVLFTLIFYKY